MPGTEQDESTLDGYFINGSSPDEDKFYDLIRTMFANDATSQALASVASDLATASKLGAAKVSLRAQYSGAGTAWTRITNLNTQVTGVISSGAVAPFTVTVSFVANTFPNANYIAHINQQGTAAAYISAQNQNSIVVAVPTGAAFNLSCFYPS